MDWTIGPVSHGPEDCRKQESAQFFKAQAWLPVAYPSQQVLKYARDDLLQGHIVLLLHHIVALLRRLTAKFRSPAGAITFHWPSGLSIRNTATSMPHLILQVLHILILIL
jgi:hypothetical protein